jgi:hypothetical protein
LVAPRGTLRDSVVAASGSEAAVGRTFLASKSPAKFGRTVGQSEKAAKIPKGLATISQSRDERNLGGTRQATAMAKCRHEDRPQHRRFSDQPIVRAEYSCARPSCRRGRSDGVFVCHIVLESKQRPEPLPLWRIRRRAFIAYKAARSLSHSKCGLLKFPRFDFSVISA